MERTEVIVIGGGPAGLATAGALKHYGIPAIVLERDLIGASWRKHYDRLHLHTVRWLSHLPGYKMPRRYGAWVSRDDVVEYLEDYARVQNLDVREGVEVASLARDDDGASGNGNSGGSGHGWGATAWRVETTGADTIVAPRVVVATGYNKHQVLPDWPGMDSYTGHLIHSGDYKNPEPYVGKTVLVVGTGNSGAEICVDLIEGGAKHVQLSVRRSPTILKRDTNGMPGQLIGVLSRPMPEPVMNKLWPILQKSVVGDLTKYGMPEPAPNAYTRFLREDRTPILDVGLVDMLKQGKVEVVAAVQALDADDVILADGTKIQPDAVIAGTGFRRGLEPLVGHLGLIAEGPQGRPNVHGPETNPDAPGIHFIGYSNPVSGMFREIAIDAKRIAKSIARSRVPVS